MEPTPEYRQTLTNIWDVLCDWGRREHGTTSVESIRSVLSEHDLYETDRSTVHRFLKRARQILGLHPSLQALEKTPFDQRLYPAFIELTTDLHPRPAVPVPSPSLITSGLMLLVIGGGVLLIQ